MHMFGVKRVDKDIFRKLPVTHLLMDDGNEKRAREDYKELMDKATFITRYIIRGFPVRLYRINDLTGNEQAAQYQPTDYEKGQYFAGLKQQDSASYYFTNFLEKNIPNYSANLYIADALMSQLKYEAALESYRKAQQFSPGDAVSAINFANAYLAIPGVKPNSPVYYDSALIYFKIAAAAFPSDKGIADKVRQLEKRNR
jgi:tetratricopeptide (TPR) repeat protein